MQVTQVIPPHTFPDLPPERIALLRDCLCSINEEDSPHLVCTKTEDFLNSAVMDVADRYNSLSKLTDDEVMWILMNWSALCQMSGSHSWIESNNRIYIFTETEELAKDLPFDISTSVDWGSLYYITPEGEVLCGEPFAIEAHVGRKVFFK